MVARMDEHETFARYIGEKASTKILSTTNAEIMVTSSWSSQKISV